MAELEEDVVSKKTKSALIKADNLKEAYEISLTQEKRLAIKGGVIGAAALAAKYAFMASSAPVEHECVDNIVNMVLTVTALGAVGNAVVCHSISSGVKDLIKKVDEKTKKMLDEVRAIYNQLKDEKEVDRIVTKFSDEISREIKSQYKHLNDLNADRDHG